VSIKGAWNNFPLMPKETSAVFIIPLLVFL